MYIVGLRFSSSLSPRFSTFELDIEVPCCIHGTSTLIRKGHLIPKWLAPNLMIESDYFFSISRLHESILGFVFTHFFNVTSALHEVSSVSSESNVTHSKERFSH